MMVIRDEHADDAADIRDLTRRAFEGRPYSDGTEPAIVDALRAQRALAVSLVAEEHGRIVGHVAFSPAIATDGSRGWYTLGPISVDPDLQRRGIGTTLINTGIARLRQMNAAGCILIGDTTYYARFAFTKAPHLAPPGEPAEHFMILCLGSPMPISTINFHAVFHPPSA